MGKVEEGMCGGMKFGSSVGLAHFVVMGLGVGDVVLVLWLCPCVY